MINGKDLKNLICIHRKHFIDIGLPKEGTVVSIYYKYDNEMLQILDYSIQFIVNSIPGANVADQQDIVPDPLYQYLFKNTYRELHNHILTQIK